MRSWITKDTWWKWVQHTESYLDYFNYTILKTLLVGCTTHLFWFSYLLSTPSHCFSRASLPLMNSIVSPFYMLYIHSGHPQYSLHTLPWRKWYRIFSSFHSTILLLFICNLDRINFYLPQQVHKWSNWPKTYQITLNQNYPEPVVSEANQSEAIIFCCITGKRETFLSLDSLVLECEYQKS